MSDKGKNLIRQKSFWVSAVSVVAFLLATYLDVEINQENAVMLVLAIVTAIGGTHAVDNVRNGKES